MSNRKIMNEPALINRIRNVSNFVTRKFVNGPWLVPLDGSSIGQIV